MTAKQFIINHLAENMSIGEFEETIENEEFNPLDIVRAVKELEAKLKSIKENRELVNQMFAEIGKYSRLEPCVIDGRIFTECQKTTYNFKHIPGWQRINNERKEFEASLKIIKPNFEDESGNPAYVDEETGEITILPTSKSTSFIKMEIKKESKK